ncbi:MAG: tRNA lysidine(34) synthetase TilS [Ruegeria sp.]|uniref:tRNA lysidine(34) synthetase TilS n=1 Tax=Ruegeria sp. TaxID=1879320 RepID=UPI00349ED372
MTQETDRLRADLRAQLPSELPRRLGVAVSGGGDSIALLDLLVDVLNGEGVAISAATVDHGLRPEAAKEAAQVAALAARLGIAHETLRWEGWDGSGNLQDQARQARYHLLTGWARRNGITLLALGHTADDQAETVLMRLGRAAGVTGLSAMPVRRVQDGVTLWRPMLGITRARLRDHLRARGLNWIEDPSNQDTRFDRIKAREALTHLGPLGITAESLASVAQNLAQARDALDHYTLKSAQNLARPDEGDVLLNLRGFSALPEEIARRLLLAITGWIAGHTYPPRRAAVQEALTALHAGRAGALGGCLILRTGDEARFCREYNAIRDIAGPVDQPWDNRWTLTGPTIQGATVRALGEEGLTQMPDWRATGRPQAALIASPAVWKDGDLLAAPIAGYANGWQTGLLVEWEEFLATLLSH